MSNYARAEMPAVYSYTEFTNYEFLRQHRTIPALRLKHRSGSCGTASALPKCSIMSGCGTRIVLRRQKPLALCDRCPCFGSLFPPLAALTFAASSIICAFGLASAAPRSPYRHLELCGIALTYPFMRFTAVPSQTGTEWLRCRGGRAGRWYPGNQDGWGHQGNPGFPGRRRNTGRKMHHPCRRWRT